jgi:phosphodiesterase/alkaline phosphatase D-like protein
MNAMKRLKQVVVAILMLFTVVLPLNSAAQWITHGPIIGAVGPDSACVYIRSTFAMSFDLEYSTDPQFASGVSTLSSATRPNLDNTMIVLLQGLAPSTRYYLRFKFGGQVDTTQGSFKTFPVAGQAGHYVLTAGSCQETADMDVFLEIPRHDPDLFIHLGDWTYPSYQLPNNYPEDWSMVELSYRKRYEEINMREMLRDLPVDYVYDDDDFTEGGSTRNYYNDILDSTVGLLTYHRIVETYVPDSVRRNCIKGYQQFFPHYALVDTSEGIFHKFTLGNAEVFFLDTRSTASPLSSTLKLDTQSGQYSFDPGPDNTILRQIQMNWLLDGLRNSTADWKVICIGNVFNKSEKRYIDFGLQSQLVNLPGVGSGFSFATAFSNNWSGFPTDQNRLLNFIDSLGLKDIFILSGQSHNNVVDDGTNAGLPELNASGLSVADRSLSQQMQLLSLFGLPSLVDSLWNGGGNGLNGASLNNGFGKVEIYGRDSCRLSAVDKVGDVMGSVLLLHSSLLSATNNAEAVLEWQVSPVPSNDQITIRLGNPPFLADFQLVNEFGAVVRSGRMVGGEYSISIDRLPAGVYALRIVQGTRTAVRRVVIAR